MSFLVAPRNGSKLATLHPVFLDLNPHSAGPQSCAQQPSPFSQHWLRTFGGGGQSLSFSQATHLQLLLQKGSKELGYLFLHVSSSNSGSHSSPVSCTWLIRQNSVVVVVVVVVTAAQHSAFASVISSGVGFGFTHAQGSPGSTFQVSHLTFCMYASPSFVNIAPRSFEFGSNLGSQ